MADDGGSTGRLRRLYSIPPPGDLVSCIAAMSKADETMKKILTYRFAGERYGDDTSLGGHKLGNLMMVALTSVMGDFGKALFNFTDATLNHTIWIISTACLRIFFAWNPKEKDMLDPEFLKFFQFMEELVN